MTDFFNYFTQNIGYISQLFYNHIQYTIFAILIAICLGVPIGIWIFNSKTFDKPVLSLANIVQAIPSLAILGFIVPYFGIGASTAIFMVVLYSLLPILKNTYTGLKNINPDTLEAAKGIGMTRTQVLVKVQIPLALPVIMAGIRISAVTAVGLMTIAAYIGAEVLGTLVISGIQTLNTSMILSGAFPACLLALGMDFIMSRVEKAVTPVSLQLSASNLTPKAVQEIRHAKRRTAIVCVTVMAVLIGTYAYTTINSEADIVVGSKEATEGRLLGYMMAEVIESQTDLTVERRMGLGGTSIAYQALIADEIDVYPEYTGTILASVLGYEYQPGSTAEEIYSTVKADVFLKDEVYVLEPYDINSTYVICVTPALAEQYGLETLSDLAKVSSRLTIGCTPEFSVRDDGLLGIQDTYDMEFSAQMNFQGSLMYTAIDSGEVDVISGIASDSMISKYGLLILEDDLNFFPPYYAVPTANKNFVETYPEAVAALELLVPYLNLELLQEMSGLVVEEGMDASQVAHDYLVSVGLSE